MKKFRPNDLLYNSRGLNVYVKLLEKKYPHVNIPELLKYAEMAPYEVADQAHWFSQEQIDRFYEKCVQLSGNKNIAREAGRYASTPEMGGALEKVVFGQVGLATAYEIIGRAAYSYAKSSRYVTRKISSNKVEITAVQEEGVQEKPYQCQNRIGIFEAFALSYTNKLPTVEHAECIFKGGKCCRYIITWRKTAFSLWKRIRNISIPVFFVAFLAGLILNPHFALLTLFPVLFIFVLGISRIVDFLEKKDLRTSLNVLRDSTDKLLEQVDINYNHTLITNEIGQSISRHRTIDDILDKVIQISQKRLEYDRYLILLANNEKTKLEYRTGFGYTQEYLNILSNATFNLDRPDSKGVFVVAFREQKSFLINDINEIEETLSPRSWLFAKKLGTKSFICCPIICDEESIGILAVDNLKSKKLLVQSDISLLKGIASVIGISIRNAELMEGRERQYRSIMQVLASSIDARDPLTSGHSEKVTEYSLGICDEMDLAKDYREMIRVAALLHDYGKLGVPDSILKKSKALTEEEYSIVKNHAQKTREILEKVNFEGVLSQVPRIAGAHHEKLDGSGYPDGLRGDEIPLGARIIAVADFFEAITAERHYRGPMPIEKAIRLLKQESEKHLDSKVVAAFVRFFEKNYLRKFYGRNEFN